MKSIRLVLLLALMALSLCHAQDHAVPNHEPAEEYPNAPSEVRRQEQSGLASDGDSNPPASRAYVPHPSAGLGLGGKFCYYVDETYLNPAFISAPAFRAGIRMANPPGRFPTAYPSDWRQGPEGFGKNYGDAMAQRISFQTARFVSAALVREDPRYSPSSSHNPLVRSLHAFGYTFIDRSDSGYRMPAVSNFIGASAAGFVGNTYLPAGFANVTHAGQRATFQFGLFAASNLYREFAPQMPKPMRTFIGLIGR